MTRGEGQLRVSPGRFGYSVCTVCPAMSSSCSTFAFRTPQQTPRFPLVKTYRPTHARPHRRLSEPPNMLIFLTQYQMARNNQEDWSLFALRIHDPLHLKTRDHRHPHNLMRQPLALTPVHPRMPLLIPNPSRRHRSTRRHRHTLTQPNDSNLQLQTLHGLQEQPPQPGRPENATFIRLLVRKQKSTMMFGGWSQRRMILGDNRSRVILR